MTTTSKFEQGLALLEKAIPLLREAFAEQEQAVRRGIIETIAGGAQIPVVSKQNTNGKDHTGAKAPRGTAEKAARNMLFGVSGGLTWGQLEDMTPKQNPPISYSAVKKAVRRLKDSGAVKQHGNRFVLVG